MFGMFGVVLNTIPAVSTPSASTRAPPPPPKWLISVAANRNPCWLVPAKIGAIEVPDQFAIACPRYRSEASRSCARQRHVTSIVTITAEIVAIAHGAGYAALFTVPGSARMSRQSRTPRFHGMSQQRLMYTDDRTAACSPDQVELISPRAFGLVPPKSNASRAPSFRMVQTIR